MSKFRSFAINSKAWPFAEANRLLKRFDRSGPSDGYVLFETGYGPSGLPHIGTFGEVARTTMVRRAFQEVSDLPTKLIAFSDDMDGLRNVPNNIPEQEMVSAHIGMPLTSIPDPFGTHESYGHHNNARLRTFLDHFDFDYEFFSATECYRSGRFDEALRTVLSLYDEIVKIILPTLGPERQATYSPFLPVCPSTGKVLQVSLVNRDPAAGTIAYRDEKDRIVEVPVTGGHCKLQWKADWAMRWVALNVDYEMSGKDLIPSLKLSSKICRILGGRPPENLTYELFLDEHGEKISKSRGNGLTIDEWLTYGPPQSLSFYMYQSPRKAKRLHFDVIPRNVDDYLNQLQKFPNQDGSEQLMNPVWHVHSGSPPAQASPLNFGLLLNLAGACHAEDKSVLWGFITQYSRNASPKTDPLLDKLVGYALQYYRHFVAPTQRYRQPDDTEKLALEDLAQTLESLPKHADAETIQTHVYEVGKRNSFTELRTWFKALYEILLGQSQGPRMGSFIVLYGPDETVRLIRRAVAGEQLGNDGNDGST